MKNLMDLEERAIDAAQELVLILQEISDLHWEDGTVNPVYRASKATIDLLSEIETMIDCPINEIKCTL